jgi:DNA-binding transcriptional MerR regulator
VTQGITQASDKELALRRIKVTEVARTIGVCNKTILRWEDLRLIPKAQRDRNGHRFWRESQLTEIRQYADSEQEVA